MPDRKETVLTVDDVSNEFDSSRAEWRASGADHEEMF